jgi:hypothetical protein
MNRTLSRAILLLGASIAFASPALAKKKKKDKEGDAPAAAAAATPDVPDDGNSKKYAQKLLEAEIKDFSPSDGAGAKFEYTTMKFSGDNTWSAEGYVEIADERMECNEGGKWSMDPADSATEATVTWTLDSTDCPGRDSGGEIRAVLKLTKSGVEAIFR